MSLFLNNEWWIFVCTPQIKTVFFEKRMDGDAQDRKRLQSARQHALDTKKQFEDEGVKLVDVSKGAKKATT